MLKIANHTAYHKAASRRLVEALDGFDLDPDITLTIEDMGIRLCTVLDGQKTCFDHSFDTPRLVSRSRQKNQALLRACGNRKGSIHSLLDLTAGWGRDSFMLAAQGRRVLMVEHNPLVFHCLEFLIDIAGKSEVSDIVGRIRAIHGDGLEVLADLEPAGVDCIYLDPMFPAHKSGAKPSKDLQILQLLTENQTIDALFVKALEMPVQRVVVKRPLHAPSLAEQKPSMSYREKTVRFDVYLRREN